MLATDEEHRVDGFVVGGQPQDLPADAMAHTEDWSGWPMLSTPFDDCGKILLAPIPHLSLKTSQIRRCRFANPPIVVRHNIEAILGKEFRESTIVTPGRAGGGVDDHQPLRIRRRMKVLGRKCITIVRVDRQVP
jgi:hypothetical protein